MVLQLVKSGKEVALSSAIKLSNTRTSKKDRTKAGLLVQRPRVHRIVSTFWFVISLYFSSEPNALKRLIMSSITGAITFGIPKTTLRGRFSFDAAEGSEEATSVSPVLFCLLFY